MPFTFPTNATSILMVRHNFKSKYERVYGFTSYWSVTVLPTQASLDTFIQTFHEAVGAAWEKLADHESQYVETVGDYRSIEGAQVVSSYNEPIDGDMGKIDDDPLLEVEGLPAYATLIVQKTTGKHGRSKRGRFFVPLISEQVVHDGIIDTLNVSSARDFADLFQTDRTIQSTGTASARHWDRKNNVLEVITRCYPLDVLGTRRDRKLGRVGARIQ